LKEKLDIFSSAGTCPQLEHTNTFEKETSSHQIISTINCHSHILYDNSNESFNLFVSEDSLSEKSFTTNLSITIDTLFKLSISKLSFTVYILFQIENLINHKSNTSFLISSKELKSHFNGAFSINLVHSSILNKYSIMSNIESFFTIVSHLTHLLSHIFK